MKKIWFFVEGDSEEYFVQNLIRKKYYERIKIEKDLSEFVKKNLNNDIVNFLYCENCGSVDKIPHKINEWYYLIERSGSSEIFIICDVERRLRCLQNRKFAIENKLSDNVNRKFIKYIFFNPTIESSYWECKSIIEKIIEIQYNSKFTTSKFSDVLIENSELSSLHDLKRCFENQSLKYREAIFAKEFSKLIV